jgi:LPXTG-motif cell wall-anchored protein
VTALSIAGLASLGLVGTAQAAACPEGTYPPGSSCTFGVFTSSTVTAAGQTITITAAGFQNDSTGEITFLSTPVSLGTFTANSAGVVTATVKIPANAAAGVHHINISGVAPDGSARVLSTRIVVGGAGSGSGLPLTGGQIGAASVLAVGLLGAGTLSVVASRRRKATVSV